MSKGGGDNNAGNAAQTSANTQSAALNQIFQIIAQQQGLTGGASAALGGTGSGSLLQLLGLGTNPAALSGLTGIDGGGLTQGAVNTYNGPLAGFYTSEMQQGGGPGFQQASTNAQNQLQQQFASSLSSILGNTAPGQNPAAAEQQAQNSLLSSSANLGSQLAGQQQGIMQAGAQGLGQTTGAAAALGNQYNQSAFSDASSAITTLLQAIMGGNSSALGSLGGVQSSAGSQSSYDINLQNQENQQQQSGWDSLFSGLLGAGAAAMTGGAAGAGGLGSILKGLSDERLKTDIKPIGPRVDGLQAYSFIWKHSGARDVGFMAQDVERSHPEYVGETREGLKFVDYGAASDRFIRELERCLRSAV